MMTWLPTFFHRMENIPMSQAGMKTSGIMMLAIIGAPLGGLIADAWFKKRVNSRLLFPAITTIINAVVIFAAFSFFSGKALYMALLLQGILSSAFSAAAITVTQEVIHPGLRAISYAICVIVQNALGAATAPMVIGAISDAYGIRTAMSVLPLFLVVSALLFFAGSFFYAKDLSRVEKVAIEFED